MINIAIGLFFSISFATLVYFSFVGEGELETSNKSGGIAVSVLIAMVLRMVIASLTTGYEADMSCFRGWSNMMVENGAWGFYVDDVFCDYPPGYMYFLWIVGFANKILGSSPMWFNTLVIKLPAILCDIAQGVFFYSIGKKYFKNKSFAAAIAVLYLFNPAIIVNSSVWGQVDAVFTLSLLISLYFLSEEKYKKSAALLVVSILLKPQALMFAPIYLFTFIQKIITEKNKKIWWIELAKCVGILISVFLIFSLPFIITKPSGFIFGLYMDTLRSYPYASLNAFNLFSLFGGNFKDITDRFLFFDYALWGNIAILGSVIFSGYLFFKSRGKSKIFYISALLLSMIYTLGGKMHERYLFPAIALYMMAYILRRDKRILYTAGMFSLVHYINVAYVYKLSKEGVLHLPSGDGVLVIFSILTILILAHAMYIGLKLYAGLKLKPPLQKPKHEKNFTKKDILIMAIATILYSSLAFTNLGDTTSPQTAFDFTAKEGAIADLGQVKDITALTYFKGLGDSQIKIIGSSDGQEFSEIITFETDSVFRWDRQEINATARFVGVMVGNKDVEIFEMGFFSGDEQIKISYSADELFDEQELVAPYPTYLNGTYFDEIYHARTAYEHLNNITPYENTHPPLGKLIIAVGIKLFGMNPFGWRVMGTLVGVLMLPLMFMLGKKIFKNTLMATGAMLLMAFDLMHFTQTRIATIDSYGVFFIMLMYYFMYLYYDGDGPYKKSLCILLGCGISFGFGVASKWICLYAGAGLAILFFMKQYRIYKEDKEVFSKTFLKTCLWCLLFFVVIPFGIYFASYIPINIADGSTNYLRDFLNYQKHMFTYHSGLTEPHPFSSTWVEWPTIARPMWYYGDNTGFLPEGKVSSIVALGNPLIWWSSILAVFYLAVRKLKDKEAKFIMIAFLSQYAPWIAVTRPVFIYHFFASLPFVILAIIFVFKEFCEKKLVGKRYLITYLCIALLLFVMFYPIISGITVDKSYVTDNLKWFDRWVLSY